MSVKLRKRIIDSWKNQ